MEPSGFAFVWLVGTALSLVSLGVMVLAIVSVSRIVWNGGFRPDDGDRAAEILRERFARGELTAEEFEERRRVMEE